MGMIRQVKFMIDDTFVYNGIMLENGDIICAHCGEKITTEQQEYAFKILKVYDSWVDFSEYIGDIDD